MTHEAIPIEKEKATSVHVLTGILTAVYEDDGTVDVTIDGHGDFSSVPVFYHCQGVETADGMPFIDGDTDRVVIVNYGDPVNLSVADMKVVGFEDGLPRECSHRFCIRPTFNSFSPVRGGERIEVKHPDYVPGDSRKEIGTTRTTGDFAGLCGPFSREVASGDEYISLDGVVYGGDARELFAHYVEKPQSEADLHIEYSFPIHTYGSPILTFVVEPTMIPGDADFHLNKIKWLRYGNLLSECSKTQEAIDGEIFDIYQVNFTELYFLKQTRSWRMLDLRVPPTCTQGCGPVGVSPLVDVFDNLEMVESHENIGRSSGGGLSCYGYGWPHPHPWKMEDLLTYNNYVAVFGFEIEQLCILSDELGQNPEYLDFTVCGRFYIKHQKIYWDSPYSVICEINDIDYGAGYSTYTYTKELTAEDMF